MNNNPIGRRAREWTAAERQRIINLAAEGTTYRELGRLYGVSHNTISGIVFRHRHGHKYKADRPPAERRKYEAQHVIRDLKPAKAPFAPDCSCPDFAYDDLHCEAVHAERPQGYPVLRWR